MSQIEERYIEVRTANAGRSRQVPAWCFHEFAVHQWNGHPRDEWRMTHLPTGLLVAKGEWSRDDAIKAMIEVHKLRNDWAEIEDGDLTRDLANKVSAICEKYRGFRTGGDREFKRGWNGYGASAQ